MTQELQPTDIADDALILDVREQDEWDAGHAPGAVHVPLGEVAEKLGELPTGDPLPIICRSGRRSMNAAQWLEQQGFAVANVTGGMQQWAAAGKPVVNDGGSEPTVI